MNDVAHEAVRAQLERENRALRDALDRVMKAYEDLLYQVAQDPQGSVTLRFCRAVRRGEKTS